MTLPRSIIDLPGPYESPEVLWAFLRRLRNYNQDDPAVQEARQQVMEYLRGKTPPPSSSHRG